MFRSITSVYPLVFVVAVSVVGSESVHAQQQTVEPPASTVKASPASKDAVELKAVIVNGANNGGTVESTTARMIVTQEDLSRFGDSNVADVLKRLPGITVSGVPGRGGEIRMRGLGNGYTQILINGDPVAQGFSLDSITPSSIERIEVTRTPTADLSAQAIAGTINVILKQVVRKRQRDLKVAASNYNGRPSLFIDTQLSDKKGDLSYTLAGGYKEERYFYPVNTRRNEYDATGQHTYATDISDDYSAKIQTLTLIPRVNWTLDPRNSLSWDAQLIAQRASTRRDAEFETSVGTPLPYSSAANTQQQHSENIRNNLLWKRNLENDATLETKLGARYGQNQRPGTTKAFDDSGALVLRRDVTSPSKDTSITLNGKYRTPFRKTHALVLGWDGETTRRREDRLQEEISPIGLPLDNADERFDARVRRIAAFAQDEWDIAKRWSAYLGLRSETIVTRSNDNTDTEFSNRAQVLSPIVQTLWKIPDTKSDQIRLGLSRTFKAPTAEQLTPRRYISLYTAPTAPGIQGNPALRPELAWSLDLTYERHFEGGGLFSTNLYERRIKDVILQEVFQDDLGRWIEHPINNGDAKVHGIEFEAKAGLREWAKTAPAIDIRANLSRNWSTVENIPGPNNRLAQVPTSATIGADWHLKDLPLTIGASLGFQQGGILRRSANDTIEASNKHTLDLYTLWVIDPKTQVRFSASNLLNDAIVEKRDYFYDTGDYVHQHRSEETGPILRVTLELKL